MSRQARLLCSGFALSLTLAVTSSCSLYRLGLRYSEWLIFREADKYFDLDREQSRLVKEEISQAVVYAKKVLVPIVVTELEAFEQAWHDGLSTEEVQKTLLVLKRVQRQLGRHVIERVAKLVPLLTVNQIGHAANAFTKKNDEFADLLAKSDNDLADERRDKLSDSLSFWYGEVGEGQLTQICLIGLCDRQYVDRQLKFAIGRQEVLLAAIRDGRSQDKWLELAIPWVEQEGMMMSSRLRSDWILWQSHLAERLMILDSVMTAGQRERARKTLRDITSDLKWYAQST